MVSLKDNKGHSVCFNYDNESEELVVSITGSFDFNCRPAFINGCENLPRSISKCTVDLTKTTYMDSSGLGMLLVLKSHEYIPEQKIVINTKGNMSIAELMNFHNFNQLFTIANG